MKTVTQSPMKTCPKCGELKPLDPQYWRRDKSSPTGFNRYCKACTQKSIKAHYRRFTYIDKAKRGKVGVKCLLWSPKCGVCPCVAENDLSACWRLSKIKPSDVGYPKELA
jgi:hypothetical protein